MHFSDDWIVKHFRIMDLNFNRFMRIASILFPYLERRKEVLDNVSVCSSSTTPLLCFKSLSLFFIVLKMLCSPVQWLISKAQTVLCIIAKEKI